MEAKGVVKALEGDGVGNGIEGGVLARNAALGVVGETRLNAAAGGELTVELEEANEEDDLNAGGEGKGIPLLGRRKASGGEGGSVQSHGPGEVEVGLHAVTDEGGHGDTAVLDLGLSEPSNGELIALAPEGAVSDAEGIEVANDGIELGAKLLEISLYVCVRALQSKHGTCRRKLEAMPTYIYESLNLYSCTHIHRLDAPHVHSNMRLKCIHTHTAARNKVAWRFSLPANISERK